MSTIRCQIRGRLCHPVRGAEQGSTWGIKIIAGSPSCPPPNFMPIREIARGLAKAKTHSPFPRSLSIGSSPSNVDFPFIRTRRRSVCEVGMDHAGLGPLSGLWPLVGRPPFKTRQLAATGCSPPTSFLTDHADSIRSTVTYRMSEVIIDEHLALRPYSKDESRAH
jgi:hypothetical protein